VRSTGEIGLLLLRKTEKIRGIVRLEFLAGLRASARARADYDLLNRAAQMFSSTLEDVPDLVAAQLAKAAEADKGRKKLAAELAELQGKDLYEKSEPDASGVRRRIEVAANGPLSDETRIRAQAFVAGSKAQFLAITQQPATILYACSADSGVHAGNVLKPLLQAASGRGGGNAALAQGSVPDQAALAGIASSLGFAYLP
jgi:alanyl-tRNA synthetase